MAYVPSLFIRPVKRTKKGQHEYDQSHRAWISRPILFGHGRLYLCTEGETVVANTFTPTAASAAVAGFGFYALVWSIALKLDTIASLFGFRDRKLAPRVREWINSNKGLTLCITEVINFSIHGITNPAAVTFAIGGTLFNVQFVCVLNPIMCVMDIKRKPIKNNRVAA